MKTLSRWIAVALVVLFTIACAKGKAPSPEECAAIFREAAELTVAIGDIATSDEEVQAKIERAAAITELAAELGCPIVIPMLEGDD